MTRRSLSKLQSAKKQAVRGAKPLRGVQLRVFHDDVLKHFIRTNYWKKRIEKLIRTRDIPCISYFSLCADTAFDARLFKNGSLIDFTQQRPTPFGYCEYDRSRFDLLDSVFKSPCRGFFGRLEEMATDSGHQEYSKFWGSFPYDVINLDFWGDIHKANDPIQNVYYAINAIVSQQALLRKPYELWITWRAKDERVDLVVKSEYKGIINRNLDDSKSFLREFEKLHSHSDPDKLNEEELVNIGFIKWLLYITNRSFSIIEDPEVLLYTKEDKDGKKYHLMNFLLRIHPYEYVIMPSPAGQAAEFCESSYSKNMTMCFQDPIDVDKEFRKLPQRKKESLKRNLLELKKEYMKDTAGHLHEK